jgi:hypothetical protein
MGIRLGSIELADVKLGGASIGAVYLGSTKVWPEKAKFIEEFNVSQASWPQFVMTRDNTKASTQGGKATVAVLSSGQAYDPGGYFIHNELLTNSHYVDITLAPPLSGATLDTGASGEQLIITLRRPSTGAAATQMDFRIRASGGIEIYSWSGSTGTKRADVTGKSYAAGHVLRMVAQENGLHAIYNMTTAPTVALASWTDSTRVLNYDAEHRYTAMSQGTNYPFAQKQYACYGVDRLEYGDL